MPQRIAVPRKDSAGRDLEEGWETIRVLGLNIGTLPEERAGSLENLRALETMMKAGWYNGNPMQIKKAADEIKAVSSAERRFAGFRRYFFRNRDLGDYVSDD